MQRILSSIGLLLFALFPGVSAQEGDLASLEQTALRRAADAVAPCVVQIETVGGLEIVDRRLVGSGPTTGLIVAEDGYVVSSAFNFIQQPSSILVTLPDGQRRPATIVARDQSRMLVLLKVATETPLPVPIAVPRPEMQVGQWTVAVGRALSAQEISLSVGILSALDRIWGKAIQTDAKVSPSNYGGPLVDLHGRVLGVLVPLAPEEQTEVAGAEWYDSGIGFAVPLVDLQQRLDDLRAGRDLAPGILGIGLKSRDLYAEENEIAVVEVKSPAAEAGLQAGDRIVRVNTTEIQRGVQLKHALGPLYAGDTVELVVLRDETKIETKATLVDQLLPYERPFLGILPQSSAEDGVPIRFVFPESGAAQAGLQPRDRIRTVEGKPVRDAAQLRTELANRQPQEEISLDVEREGSILSRKARLSGQPTEIPPEFPPDENLPEAERASSETGVIEVRIAEHANSCSAYVPEEYDGRRPYGLLVSLAPPGSEDPAKWLDPWKEACARHDLILLAPQSQDAQRWMPTEVDFVRKTIDQMLGRYRIDRSRIAVHGREGGATMAYLVSFTQRDAVRGVIAEDAPPPRGLREPRNEPLQPLAILATVASQSPLESRITAGLDRLRTAKFAVTVIDLGQQPRPLTPAERLLVGRWIESLAGI